MSDFRRHNADQRREAFWQRIPRRRVALYAVIISLIVLVLAYIDGGEEPIRPIAQTIEAPDMAVESE